MNLNKEAWKTVKLQDVCEKTRNVDYRKQSGDFNYVDIGSINSEMNRIALIQQVDWVNASSRARQVIKKNDTLFSTVRVNLKRVALVDKDIPNGIASTGFTVLRAKDDLVNPLYLFYTSISPNFLEKLIRLQTGTAYPAVSDKIVFNQEIPLPSIREQQFIADLFQNIEQSILHVEEQENNIKELALTFIKDLTSDSPKLGNLLIQVKKLLKTTLGEVAFEYSKREDNPKESKYDKYVGSDSIDRFDFKVEKWQSNNDVISSMKTFEPKDYLLVRRSLYASDFRERAPRADFYGLCSGDILTIKENNEKLSDGYLLIILNSPKLWEYIVSNASGSITRRIKWNELSKFEISIPDLNTQKLIVELFDQIQITFSQIKQQKIVLMQLKQKLLNELLG